MEEDEQEPGGFYAFDDEIAGIADVDPHAIGEILASRFEEGGGFDCGGFDPLEPCDDTGGLCPTGLQEETEATEIEEEEAKVAGESVPVPPRPTETGASSSWEPCPPPPMPAEPNLPPSVEPEPLPVAKGAQTKPLDGIWGWQAWQAQAQRLEPLAHPVGRPWMAHLDGAPAQAPPGAPAARGPPAPGPEASAQATVKWTGSRGLVTSRDGEALGFLQVNGGIVVARCQLHTSYTCKKIKFGQAGVNWCVRWLATGRPEATHMTEAERKELWSAHQNAM